MDKDGQHKEIVAIHRAIYGSLERFIGCLIEHYKGAFPLWLAPVQTVVMPITNENDAYAEEIFKICRAHGLRTELNQRSEKIGYRIRDAEVKKVPYILIVGKKEAQNKTVAVRKHGKGDLGEMTLDDFFTMVRTEQGGAD
jgi:threonyl-tRNA synthetase